ncbi:MAG: hypothetical protein GSR86_07265 [Desulfurococcales archaeon]|nr:hypothetical protein [Desulfurococcales archaeon]
MGRILIATLGFSMDFILKRVYDREMPTVGEVEILALWTDEGSWGRIIDAYNLLRMTLDKAGVRSRLRKITFSNRIVGDLRKELLEIALENPEAEIELFLTGGPRMLVIATLLAAISLREDIVKRVTVTAYGENFPGTLNTRLYQILVLSRLDKKSELILHAIAKGITDSSRLMEEVKMPKSSFYLKIAELDELGLIKKEGRGRVGLQEGVDNVI